MCGALSVRCSPGNLCFVQHRQKTNLINWNEERVCLFGVRAQLPISPRPVLCLSVCLSLHWFASRRQHTSAHHPPLLPAAELPAPCRLLPIELELQEPGASWRPHCPAHCPDATRVPPRQLLHQPCRPSSSICVANRQPLHCSLLLQRRSIANTSFADFSNKTGKWAAQCHWCSLQQQSLPNWIRSGSLGCNRSTRH